MAAMAAMRAGAVRVTGAALPSMSPLLGGGGGGGGGGGVDEYIARFTAAALGPRSSDHPALGAAGLIKAARDHLSALPSLPFLPSGGSRHQENAADPEAPNPGDDNDGERWLAEFSERGTSNGNPLYWVTLTLPPRSVLPVHGHPGLEAVFLLDGALNEVTHGCPLFFNAFFIWGPYVAFV